MRHNSEDICLLGLVKGFFDLVIVVGYPAIDQIVDDVRLATEQGDSEAQYNLGSCT